MSGSGRGGYVPPESTKFDCNTTVLNTAVSSVDLEVLSRQKINNILQVELSETEVVILVDANGETLGSIVHLNTSELIQCINEGNNYIATITSINTPACRVRIEST